MFLHPLLTADVSSTSSMSAGEGSEQPLVLLACAIGRLSVDNETGALSPAGSHELVADSLNEQTVTPAKKARQHIKAILNKGAHKLQPGTTTQHSMHSDS